MYRSTGRRAIVLLVHGYRQVVSCVGRGDVVVRSGGGGRVEHRRWLVFPLPGIGVFARLGVVSFLRYVLAWWGWSVY